MSDVYILTIDDILFVRVFFANYARAFIVRDFIFHWGLASRLSRRLWISIESWVFELGCCIAEVKNLQMPLIFVLAKSSTTTDNLLKLSH